MERFSTSPRVPSGPCSTTSTTAWRKFGSSSDGLATKSTPFPTDDGANSMPARAGTACRTVRSAPSRKLAMTLRAPVKPGAREYSDVRTENTYILFFSRLQWEIRERLRLAAGRCQLSLAKWRNTRICVDCVLPYRDAPSKPAPIRLKWWPEWSPTIRVAIESRYAGFVKRISFRSSDASRSTNDNGACTLCKHRGSARMGRLNTPIHTILPRFNNDSEHY